MRRKTIGRNPLDQLEGAPRKGKGKGKGKRKAVPAAPGVQSEIREVLMKSPGRDGGSVVGWIESVLRRITG